MQQGARVGWRNRVKRLARTIGEVIYGMTVYEMVRELKRERKDLENLFCLAVFGDLLGIPILPPYYALRIFPYIIPSLPIWKREMLREKDITELFDHEIG